MALLLEKEVIKVVTKVDEMTSNERRYNFACGLIRMIFTSFNSNLRTEDLVKLVQKKSSVEEVIPVSSLTGWNVLNKDAAHPWYKYDQIIFMGMYFCILVMIKNIYLHCRWKKREG